jgi:hypothetical protein
MSKKLKTRMIPRIPQSGQAIPCVRLEFESHALRTENFPKM